MQTNTDYIFILASHNRKDLTIRAIKSALESCLNANLSCKFILHDDDSKDGTKKAIDESFGNIVTILNGSGRDYWAKSMSSAEHFALNSIPHPNTKLVWLNDDVEIDQDAFARLHKISLDKPHSILVASVRDPFQSETSYGGLSKIGMHPLSFSLVEPSETLCIPVDTFHGNIVIVPLSAAKKIGGIDGGYSHALADIDYGIRAKLNKISVLLAPGTYGECSRNSPPHNLSIYKEWKLFYSVKGGGEPYSMARVLKKTSPILWPFWFTYSYFAWWFKAFFKRASSKLCNK